MKQRYKAILCIICAAFCFSLMNVFVRLAGELPTVEKAFFRNLIAMLVATVVLLRSRDGFLPSKGCLPLLLGRSACGTLGLLCNFYAIDHLMVADASMLNKMSPFFAIVFSALFLKETLTAPQVMGVAAAFAGSMLIVKPTFSNLALVPSVMGLIGGLGAGIAYTFVRALGQKGERGSYIVFFFSAFSVVTILPLLVWQYQPMTVPQLLSMLGAGMAAAGGQFSITRAYCYAPAREVSVYDYTQIVFSALLGWFIFAQVPDVWSVAGYCIICSVAVAMFLYNNRPAAQ